MLRLLSSATRNRRRYLIIVICIEINQSHCFEIKEKGNIESIRSEINSLSEQKSAIGYQKLRQLLKNGLWIQILAQVDDEGLNSLSILHWTMMMSWC